MAIQFDSLFLLHLHKKSNTPLWIAKQEVIYINNKLDKTRTHALEKERERAFLHQNAIFVTFETLTSPFLSSVISPFVYKIN